MITIISALSKNNVIGWKNKLPWNIKSEMQHFLSITKNKNVLFGFNTFKNLPKIYSHWKIIVLTKKHQDSLLLKQKNIFVTDNINQIINKYQNSKEDLYICGGSQIYKQFLNYAHCLILSIIDKNYIGDAFFPKINYDQFQLIKIKKYQLFQVKYYLKKSIK